mmetsp:Transcript_63542/g.138383  ORF Transcript_63542/g.138383 Transcript_63542/m.138383 type:complete len:205 (+) Transcript_63542:37-651(+)
MGSRRRSFMPPRRDGTSPFWNCGILASRSWAFPRPRISLSGGRRSRSLVWWCAHPCAARCRRLRRSSLRLAAIPSLRTQTSVRRREEGRPRPGGTCSPSARVALQRNCRGTRASKQATSTGPWCLTRPGGLTLWRPERRSRLDFAAFAIGSMPVLSPMPWSSATITLYSASSVSRNFRCRTVRPSSAAWRAARCLWRNLPKGCP